MSFTRTPDGHLIAATTGYFLTDNLGSTIGIGTNTGTKTASYAYDPYGRTRTATGPNATANAYRYAGGLYDTTTGATKFGARYYDPNTGRFTQPDPSGQEENLYAYAAGNPTNYIDPTGLVEWENVVDAVVGGALGVVVGSFCEAVTVGAGTVGCAVLGTAVGAAATLGLDQYGDEYRFDGYSYYSGT